MDETQRRETNTDLTFQIVGYAVALSTLREFVQYALRMRIGMTCKARGYDLMFFPVAKGTTEIMMLGRIVL